MVKYVGFGLLIVTLLMIISCFHTLLSIYYLNYSYLVTIVIAYRKARWADINDCNKIRKCARLLEIEFQVVLSGASETIW